MVNAIKSNPNPIAHWSHETCALYPKTRETNTDNNVKCFVKHFLGGCDALALFGQRIFNANFLNDLFDDVAMVYILSIFRKIKLYQYLYT